MRISELSQLSGLSPATIKFYVRDRLLPEGERNGYNRTEYGDHHLERLRLVRALVEVGGLPLATVQRVLASIDEPDMPLGELLGEAQRALARSTGPAPTGPASAAALERVAEVARERGWRVHEENPGIAQVALTLDAYTTIGRDDLTRSLPSYAQAAETAAETDLDLVATTADDRQRTAETVVVGTVLGDRLLAGLRRMAQEHISRQRYGMDEPDGSTNPCRESQTTANRKD